MLQWYWTTSGGQVGPYVLCSVNEIPATHDYDQLLKYKMIPIGDAANGDILVIRFVDEDCAVGLVSHDQLWEGESDPVQAYAEVTPCIDEYLWRVVESRYLPIDYYAASELVELRRSISESQTL